MTHICVRRLTITGSDNGLSPGRRQAIIWTNAGILLIGPLGTNFSENSLEILTFSFTKMRLKVSSAKWRPFCLGLNVLTHWHLVTISMSSSTSVWVRLSTWRPRSLCHFVTWTNVDFTYYQCGSVTLTLDSSHMQRLVYQSLQHVWELLTSNDSHFAEGLIGQWWFPPWMTFHWCVCCCEDLPT